ncbi:HAD family hydrolase [Nonomuraea basaltis]|uniref:HAD family hydrolase n=1 Tax=Nonomuraea basaltis TaxID=2495887 RepID=UPI00110C49D4|nr:haloacid dehalogenase-like hydrolase [Nonomuraea basaltis]TMR94457.1 hydrolase [Nonomuraea basaltis]
MGAWAVTVVAGLVLWDVDHTLIENGGVSKEIYARAFELLTGRPAEHRAETGGRTDPQIMLNLLRRHGIEPSPDQLTRLNDALKSAMTLNRARLSERGYALPGALDAIVALAEVPGIVQSVLTGNIQPNAVVKVSVFGLHERLDFELGGYGSDGAVRAGLVAVAQQRASRKYGQSFGRSSTVLIGDTPRDVQAGVDGGAAVIGVATGSDSMAELSEAGADVVFSDLTDTPALVAAVMKLTGLSR